MKRFCIKTLCFAIAVFLLLIAIGAAFPYNPDGYNREQLIKDRLLKSPNRNPSIVLLGGSSVAFGFNSSFLTELSNMPVINDGLHAGLGFQFIVDNCSQYIKKGDLLVVIPEYSHFAGKSAYGGQPLTDVVLLNPKDYFSLLNQEQLYALMENFPGHMLSKISFNLQKIKRTGADNGVYCKSSFNEYGDCVGHYGLPNRQIGPPTNQGTRYNQDFEKHLLNKLDQIKSSGVEVIMFPPPITASLYEYNISLIDTISSRLEKSGYPFVINTKECIYSDSLFFDTHYHLNEKGDSVNTAKLFSHLKMNYLLKY